MNESRERGSQKLLEAWKSRDQRLITEDHIQQLAEVLEQSPAVVDDVTVVGGDEADGVGFALSYYGDDIPFCGNDMSKILELLRRLGTPSQPPVVIINGKPGLDRLVVLATLGVLPAQAWDAVIPKYQAGLGR